MTSASDPVLVPFQGELLACATWPDAHAIRLADSLLSNNRATGCALTDLDRIASVLVRYEQFDAAEKLKAAAHRQFAGALLSHFQAQPDHNPAAVA